MRLRPALSLAAAGVATAAALALPGAATATTFTHEDAIHDVQRFDLHTQRITKRPQNHPADITRTTFVYTRRSLETTIHVRSGSIVDTWLIAGRVRTGRATFDWFGFATPGHVAISLTQGHDMAMPCDGITHHVAREKGRITVSIPASCLHRPHHLQAGVGFAIPRNGDHEFVDDGLRVSGLTENTQLALSPTLRLKHP